VPEHVPGAVLRTPQWEARPGTVMFRMPGVGRFLIRPSEPVRVERVPGATAEDVRCFLDGPAVAAAAILEGLVPLRAATVAIGGRAVAIAGPSAAGKSAVAAALAQHGHPVLADRVTVPSPADGGSLAPTVEPLAPDPVLWPDVVAQLGLDPEAGRPVRQALAKRAFRLGPEAEPAPAPLAAVVLLGFDPLAAEPHIERVAGLAKTAPILAAGWCRNLVEATGAGAARFASVASIAATCACFQLTRPRTGATPGDLAALVEGLSA
jgi:hypothetical protein